MVLNLQKNKGRLRTALFVQPILVVALAFLALYGVFNLAMRLYLNDQTETAIARQFARLDGLYQGESHQGESSASLLDVAYMIVHEDQGLVYLSASQADEALAEEAARLAVDLLEEIEEEETDEDQHRAELGGFLNLEGHAYYVRAREYEGQLVDSYVRETKVDELDYVIYVFADVTPVQALVRILNLILLALMLATFALTLWLMFWTSQRLAQAFGQLKNYILAVGSRKAQSRLASLPYREFEEVAETVSQMSDMIDSNQRSQQVFFQNSSHELRTPLMSIQGYAEGIKAGVVDSPKQAASIIEQESLKMGRLVDDILTLSKMETTQEALDLEELSITDLLYDCTWKLKAAADERGLVFIHDFESTYLAIEADEVLLERAVTNILSNAVRYAQKEIKLTVRAEDDGLHLLIANDGPAIVAEDLPHVFERFYKGKQGNFGIGLAMTKEIIARHQGQITVKSEEDWTVFEMVLPMT